MTRPKSKNPRNKDINIRLKQSELDKIKFVSDALGVSRTDAIMLSIDYLVKIAKRRYKRKGGYAGMRYATREEIEKEKERQLEEWREQKRQEALEELEEEINGDLSAFDSDRAIEDYIYEQKEKIEEWLDEQAADVADEIDDKLAQEVEAIEEAEEELKEYVHNLIFGE